jgi:hypothetical protein
VTSTAPYIRYCSANARVDGSHVGIFGLVNVLGRHGMLSPAEEAFRRENNAWYDAAYPDPCRHNPDAYAHPLAAAWFKATSGSLVARVDGYLAILDTHRVAWQRLETTDPGRVTYEDDYQVVAIPDPS